MATDRVFGPGINHTLQRDNDIEIDIAGINQ